MKTEILKYLHCVAFIAALSVGSVAALAGEGGSGDEQQTKGSQVPNIVQSGQSEQAAMIQMGISQEQLSSLMGGQGKEQQQQQKKFVYKPRDATEVEKPQRLFYNIPRWH